jgi:ATP-binding cassette, subfamily F, member 3
MPGNYSAYTVERELALKHQQQRYVTQQKEIARLEEAIRRFRTWFAIAGDHRNIVRARNKQRQIDRIEQVDKPVFERRRMALELRPRVRGGQKVIELRNVTVAFDGDPILLDLDLTVFRGERVGVIGPNGAGKTALGMALAGLIEPALGERWIGPSIHVCYLRQEPAPLSAQATPIGLVRSAKALCEQEVVNLLGRHLFRYDQMRGPVAELSGGERIRLEHLLLSHVRGQLPDPRRAYESPGHRVAGVHGERGGAVRRNGSGDLARSVFPGPDSRPDPGGP